MRLARNHSRSHRSRAAAASAAVFAVGLIAAAAGLAGRGDPQKRITPADQSRAEAMLLHYADFKDLSGATVDRLPVAGSPYCEGTDQSDLTLTGDAQSARFSPLLGGNFVYTFSRVYSSVADVRTAWRRVTSPQGVACAVSALRRQAATSGVRFISFRTLAFPAVAPKTMAFRWRYAQKSIGPLAVDFLLLAHSRAVVQIVFEDWDLNRDEEIHLARIVAQRMAKAMHGG